VTNPQLLDALARWLRDNPPAGAGPMVLEARAGLKRRLKEINGLVAGQEREVALAGPRVPEKGQGG
jgi:hypothetical protein